MTGPTVSELLTDAATGIRAVPEAQWTARADAHRERAEAFLAPHRRRAAAGESHPVWDFLFTYYSLRPRHLTRWYPGYGVVLAGTGARDYLGRTGYTRHTEGVTVGLDYLRGRQHAVRFIADLLAATQDRPAVLNCFGLHEWAMVYRSSDIRHDGVPLRLGVAGTDAVVESMPLRCTHFDAFRFFTDAAAPRNAVALTRDTQIAHEQPGCVHATMDLYKWCAKLGPLVEAELLLDCLELAADARELDMRASPYDLTGYGLTPIRIEDATGRAEYVRCQRGLSLRAALLRSMLRDRCDLLLMADAADDAGY
ncbi:3-methyladenine DNA glycosylase [Mycolicibacterium mengxianglii]|uniref:3-methyladenine DNA glycosylase n=1 Tax=Mycolicibacterium mengxianglii TaxID=2736649 RepID=UPI0027DA3086|nr:3-methyladenine DNA glycosylase [Mycolicibacterium mengxianglii]